MERNASHILDIIRVGTLGARLSSKESTRDGAAAHL